MDPIVPCLCALYMLYGTFALLQANPSPSPSPSPNPCPTPTPSPSPSPSPNPDQEIFLVLIEATPPEVDAHAVRIHY